MEQKHYLNTEKNYYNTGDEDAYDEAIERIADECGEIHSHLMCILEILEEYENIGEYSGKIVKMEELVNEILEKVDYEIWEV